MKHFQNALFLRMKYLIRCKMPKEKPRKMSKFKTIVQNRNERRRIDDMVKHSRLLRERFLNDEFRPTYHFTVPEDLGIPGDPNGAFFANGRYHLMYLYERRESGFCWGHISSHDLVHWRHHPDAIGPGEGDDGCFSGGAFVDDDGTAYLSYWKLGKGCGIGIARSNKHQNDPNYEHWEKIPGSVIPAIRTGISEQINSIGNKEIVGCADPSNIWKKDGVYYMETGNLLVLNEYGRDQKNPIHQKMRGDWVDLFKSTDFQHWQYLHRFYDRDPTDKWTDGTEDDMCPSFLPLPQSPECGKSSGKYLQLFIAHNKGAQYYIGDYDEDLDKFIPRIHGRMSKVDNTFFAPEALIDGKGRQIMWAWLLDNPSSNNNEKKRGWSGVFCLPRVLWLGNDGNLCQAIPPEFQVLRQKEHTWNYRTLTSGEDLQLNGVDGASCEIELTIEPKSAQKCGLRVRTSPNREETTLLYYDAIDHNLVFNSLQSSEQKIGRPGIETLPFTLKTGEQLKLHLWIDRSVVDFFANDRQAITRRVYPCREDSLGIYLFSDGGSAEIISVTAWDIAPSNPY
jgi:beta-fructofuranosidase